MTTEKGIYPRGRLQNFCYTAEINMKLDASMKSEKGIYLSESLQNDWSNTEETIKVKQDMKVGKGINSAINCTLQRNVPDKKAYFPSRPDTGLNTKKPKVAKIQ